MNGAVETITVWLLFGGDGALSLARDESPATRTSVRGAAVVCASLRQMCVLRSRRGAAGP